MTNRDRIVIGVLACVAAMAGFWFLALKPKRAEADAASARAEQAQTQLQTATQALAGATRARASFDNDYATLARLGKAVPADDDAASLVFQIEAAARKAKIDFRALTVGGASGAVTPTPPQTDKSSGSSGSGGSSSSSSGTSTTPAPAATAEPSALPPGVVAGSDGMNRLPFTFVFDGDYFSLTRLLDLLRSFTTTSGDTVTVRGRLMTVESVDLQESRNGFPQVKATVNATAYLSAQPITLPAGATAPANPGATPATTTAPSTQAAGTPETPPVATAIPGAIR
jgi:hypothetical protein